MVLLNLILILATGVVAMGVFAVPLEDVEGHVKAMLKDAEDMVAHGAMGDARAIVYHCHEVAKHAEVILKALSPDDLRSKKAAGYLQEAIRHCQRVVDLGDKVDPGVTLNPATKARVAVYKAAKQLSVPQPERAQ